jgi:hypothetical protein
LSLLAPEQQIIIERFAARSLSLNTQSQWSGIPEITAVSQAPQTTLLARRCDVEPSVVAQ